jgi:hypothetical protein
VLSLRLLISAQFFTPLLLFRCLHLITSIWEIFLKFWFLCQHFIVSKKEVQEQIYWQPFNNCVMEAVKCDNFCKEFWTSKKSIRPSVLPSFSYILKPHCIKLHTIHSKIKINFEICIKLISNNITIFYPQIYFAISKQFCFLHGLIRSTRLLISEKSATYTIKWSYLGRLMLSVR